MTHKDTPSYRHLTHRVVGHGEYSGDENLHIAEAITVVDNYVYINGVNTGINVKGDPGPAGPSAYDSYVAYCQSQSLTPMSETEWVESMLEHIQADWDVADTTNPAYIANKPMYVTTGTNPDTVEVYFND